MAVQELAACVQIEEEDWILDLYFSIEDHMKRHILLSLAVALPQNLLEVRIAEERASEVLCCRQAAAILRRRMSYETGGARE